MKQQHFSDTFPVHVGWCSHVKDFISTLRETLHLAIITLWILPLRWHPNCYIQKSKPHLWKLLPYVKYSEMLPGNLILLKLNWCFLDRICPISSILKGLSRLGPQPVLAVIMLILIKRLILAVSLFWSFEKYFLMFWSSDSWDLDHEEELEALVTWEKSSHLVYNINGQFW